ncbi:MAG: hypothetical protein P9L99_08400 [Candidatus Lernaella stagnicola]|nr:hypothetical protein [Candidatus Lernaella stagnicola]
MNKPIRRQDGERGMIMLIVMLVMMGVSLLGLGSLMVVGTDIRIAGQYRNSTQSFWAAEAAVQRALWEMRENRSFTGDVAAEAIGNYTMSSASVERLSENLVRIVAQGRALGARRKIEVIVNVDTVFGAALNVGGDITLEGKPRISTEGVRLNGDAYFDLDAGTPELNVYMPSGATLNAVGDTESLNRIEKEPMDLAAVKLKDEEWRTMANMATGDFFIDNDGTYGNTDTNVTINNLNFDDVTPGPNGDRVIFVDGDLTLNGSIAGTGTLVTTGKIICTGGFVTSGTPTVTMVAQDDVLINFDTNAQSEINGLVYTEGDYELHGKINFTGVVTAFGSVGVQNPSQFTNNSDPNYWYTYSPAYNILTDPIDVLSWTEIEGGSS